MPSSTLQYSNIWLLVFGSGPNLLSLYVFNQMAAQRYCRLASAKVSSRSNYDSKTHISDRHRKPLESSCSRRCWSWRCKPSVPGLDWS